MFTLPFACHALPIRRAFLHYHLTESCKEVFRTPNYLICLPTQGLPATLLFSIIVPWPTLHTFQGLCLCSPLCFVMG